MTKKITIAVLLIILVGGAYLAFSVKPDNIVPFAEVGNKAVDETTLTVEEDVVDNQVAQRGRQYSASISFVGFGPGKEHKGTIDSVTSTFATDESMVFSGEIVADMNSINTGIDLLTTDLKSDRFFDTTTYPEATFKITGNTDTTVTGNLTVHGVTKEITVPFTTTDEGFSSNFNIDMKDFGINQTLANEVVELAINLN